jgi:serine/threonine protein kinase
LEIKIEEIKKGERIGSGGFATVYRGTWKEKTVALKQMTVGLNEETLLEFGREASLIKSLQHPNIIQLYGVIKPSNENPIMVMEFFENGNLYQLLHERNEILKFEEQLSISFDIANGMNYLHRLNPKIIHRDLKSANVLLNKEKKAVLTDFGLARVKMETQKITKTRAGSPQYMAPELFDEEGKLTEKVDIYSFGMVLFEISTNLFPFEGMDIFKIAFAVHQGKRPIIPDHCNPFFKSLIEQCWNQDYSKRPSIIEVCARLELKKETN